MLRRIKQAIETFEKRKPAAHDPDIIFVEEQKQELTRLSRFLGTSIESLILSMGAAFIGYFVEKLLTPKHVVLSVGAVTGLASGIALLILNHAFHSMNHRIGLQLRLGERLAPYFGHRLYHTYRVLRG